MKLVIFDLDQTLVDLITIHNELTRKLFRRVFGVDATLTEIDFAGKSLLDNFKELAELKRIPDAEFNSGNRDLLESYEDLFEEAIPVDGSKYVLPGARELLSELTRMNHFIVLYTGGSRRIGESVLRITGLDKYFRLRFYGTEVKARADMVMMAIEQAGKLNNRSFQGRDVVIIGDSIRDIECGKEVKALTISVATGFHSRSQLQEKGADFIFDSLKDWRKIVDIINNS
ncbi:MAG: HAD family hydrolase [Dehalococcoidales bacterium]|nr:HAD family hydrolase [Dehalococcoidales bacterium]